MRAPGFAAEARRQSPPVSRSPARRRGPGLHGCRPGGLRGRMRIESRGL
ncbi:hypothetical protein [Skermanella sp. TT6]|nr:hypothetical protein [Skermanella sp. TT6]